MNDSQNNFFYQSSFYLKHRRTLVHLMLFCESLLFLSEMRGKWSLNWFVPWIIIYSCPPPSQNSCFSNSIKLFYGPKFLLFVTKVMF